MMCLSYRRRLFDFGSYVGDDGLWEYHMLSLCDSPALLKFPPKKSAVKE